MTAEGKIFEGALVASISIENLLAQRDGVLAKVSAAIAILKEAEALAESSGIADAVKYRGFNYMLQGPDRYRDTELLGENPLAQITKRFDAGAWQHLMSESGIRTLMDTQARAEWDKKIMNEEVPELTAQNITATFGNLYDNRADIFERGVVNVFRELSWNYKTNQPFKFGKRIVVEYLRNKVLGEGGTSLGWPNSSKCDKVDDLIRVFSVMDGKPEPDHRQGVYNLIYGKESRNQKDVDTEYLSIRSFRNGNGHITFKRPDLVEKMNRIIARRYPLALPADRSEQAREFDAVKVA